jgi:transposase-like protein
MRRIYKRSERAELIAAVKSGEPVMEAAQRLKVTPTTAYTWVRKSKAGDSTLPPSPPTFMELMTVGTRRSALMVVRVGAVEIEVRAGFDAGLLRAVVAALDGGAP